MKSLHCPLCGELFKDPVIVISDGHTYERSAIEQWIKDNATSPVTGKALSITGLVPNITLRTFISEYGNISQVSAVSIKISEWLASIGIPVSDADEIGRNLEQCGFMNMEFFIYGDVTLEFLSSLGVKRGYIGQICHQLKVEKEKKMSIPKQYQDISSMNRIMQLETAVIELKNSINQIQQNRRDVNRSMAIAESNLLRNASGFFELSDSSVDGSEFGHDHGISLALPLPPKPEPKPEKGGVFRRLSLRSPAALYSELSERKQQSQPTGRQTTIAATLTDLRFGFGHSSSYAARSISDTDSEIEEVIGRTKEPAPAIKITNSPKPSPRPSPLVHARALPIPRDVGVEVGSIRTPPRDVGFDVSSATANGVIFENGNTVANVPLGPKMIVSDFICVSPKSQSAVLLGSPKPGGPTLTAPCIRWRFRVTGNSNWAIGIVPGGFVREATYLLQRGSYGLCNSGTFGCVLPAFKLHERVVEVTADCMTGVLQFVVDQDIVKSFSMASECTPGTLPPFCLGLCGYAGTCITLLNQQVVQLAPREETTVWKISSQSPVKDSSDTFTMKSSGNTDGIASGHTAKSNSIPTSLEMSFLPTLHEEEWISLSGSGSTSSTSSPIGNPLILASAGGGSPKASPKLKDASLVNERVRQTSGALRNLV